DGALYIAIHFPLFLILEDSLFDFFTSADVRGGAGVTGSHAGVGMHGQGKIAMDEIDLAGVDVIVHDLLRGGGVELLARWALEVAEDFHDNWGVLGAESFGRIDVVHAVDGDGGLGWSRRGLG